MRTIVTAGLTCLLLLAWPRGGRTDAPLAPAAAPPGSERAVIVELEDESCEDRGLDDERCSLGEEPVEPVDGREDDGDAAALADALRDWPLEALLRLDGEQRAALCEGETRVAVCAALLEDDTVDPPYDWAE
ncbi:MAG TPA: hypothetical protein VGQ83_41965 [Polyangia bacterium]|jgi:hypothetical protein